MVQNPNCHKFLWLAADNAAKTQYSFSLDDVNNNCLNEHIIGSKQAIDHLRVRGKTYHANSLRLLTCIFEAINERILVSYQTEKCIKSGLLKPDTIGSLRALFMIYCLKHQIHF